MKNLITQKDLIEKGYEVFKYAGEYLFIGDAEIYIDRGDDDIIKFHDGGKYIRFVVSQRDLTFFFKGELDMLRIGDNTDFDIKIISERVSLKQDELLDILSQIRDNDIECCRRTNKNLEDIKGILDDIKDKFGDKPHVRVSLRDSGKYEAFITNDAELRSRYGSGLSYVYLVNAVESSSLPLPVDGENKIQVYVKGYRSETISNVITVSHKYRLEIVDFASKKKNVVVPHSHASYFLTHFVSNLDDLRAYSAFDNISIQSGYYDGSRFVDYGVSSKISLSKLFERKGELKGGIAASYFKDKPYPYTFRVAARLFLGNKILCESNSIVYGRAEVKEHVKVKIGLRKDGSFSYVILNHVELVARYGGRYVLEVSVNSSAFASTLPSAVEGNNVIVARVKGIPETASDGVTYVKKKENVYFEKGYLYAPVGAKLVFETSCVGGDDGGMFSVQVGDKQSIQKFEGIRTFEYVVTNEETVVNISRTGFSGGGAAPCSLKIKATDKGVILDNKRTLRC